MIGRLWRIGLDKGDASMIIQVITHDAFMGPQRIRQTHLFTVKRGTKWNDARKSLSRCKKMKHHGQLMHISK